MKSETLFLKMIGNRAKMEIIDFFIENLDSNPDYSIDELAEKLNCEIPFLKTEINKLKEVRWVLTNGNHVMLNYSNEVVNLLIELNNSLIKHHVKIEGDCMNDDVLVNNEKIDFYKATSMSSHEDLELALVFLIEHNVKNAGVVLGQLSNDELALREINLQSEEDIILMVLAHNYVFKEGLK